MRREQTVKMLQVLLGAMIGLSLTMMGCTRKREAKLPENNSKNLYPVSAFKGTKASVITANKAQTMDAREKVRVMGDKPKVTVEKVESADVLKPMFKKLSVSANPGSTMDVKFAINSDYVTAYRIVSDEKAISALDRQLIEEENGEKRVVLFQYPIKAHGILVRRKNDRNEETSTLVLEENIDFEKATHVRVDMKTVNRIERGFAKSTSQSTRERYFSINQIDGQVLTKEEVEKLYDIRLGLPEGTLVMTQIDATTSGKGELKFYEIGTMANLSADEKRAYKTGKASNIRQCPESVKAQMAEKQGEKEECLIILSKSVEVQYRKVARKIEDQDSDISSAEIEFKATSHENAEFVEIKKDPVPHDHRNSTSKVALDDRRILEVEALKDKEFLYRRTLLDSPNNFPAVFTGVQGPVEIVKFEFQEERVVVKRSQPLDQRIGVSEVDQEELVSLPAKYLKKQNQDARGNALRTPRWVSARSTDKGAIALVDWTRNQIPNVASPLNYYSIGQCFAGRSAAEVSELDMKLNQEGKESRMLNFTLTSGYILNPGRRCTNSFLLSGFSANWQRPQLNFTFRERVSFKEYHGDHEEPILNVPFEAQRKMNFGIFTPERKKPNAFGNSGRDGTSVPLPMLHDIKDGKKITYYLGGLPKTGKLREKLIEATEEVVAEWNHTLRRSFKGTPLETGEDVILLKVEGRDDTGTGQFGDMDRSYIYYVQKQLETGVLGMAGPSPNPRSGVIENSSVLMYGGNLISQYEYLKMMAESEKEYLENMKIVQVPQQPAQPSAASGEAAPADGGEAPVDSDALMSQLIKGQDGEASELLKKAQKVAQISRMTVNATRSKLREIKDLEQKDRSALINSVRSGNANYLVLKKALSEGIASGSLGDESKMTRIVNQKMLEVQKGRVSAEQYAKLKTVALKNEFINNLIDEINKGPQTIESFGFAPTKNILEDSFEDVITYQYKTTLSHELGHALGLTHNFWGSYDKSNWLFEDEQQANAEALQAGEEIPYTRNYSSIMDYINDNVQNYQGPGPYDMNAMRAAYTGYVEISPAMVANLQGAIRTDASGRSFISANGQQIEIREGKLIHMDDMKKYLGIKSWLQYDARIAQRMPLKYFYYCHDGMVSRHPTCNRYDFGTTPLEIVENAIMNYHAMYGLRNLPGNRLEFNWQNSGNYVGRLFRSFTQIRQFMDETIYQIFQGRIDENMFNHANAAFRGMQFFHGVVATPDASPRHLPSNESEESLKGNQRFSTIQVSNQNDQGQTETYNVTLEKKWLNDRVEPGSDGRLSARGIELDKAVALIMLTQRRLGIPEYDRNSLQMAFPDFEQIFLSNNGQTPASELPSIELLRQVLTGSIDPMIHFPTGPFRLVDLSNRYIYKADTTQLMRAIAAQSAVLNLEINTLEADGNYAALFHFDADRTAPANVPLLTQLGVRPESSTQMKYWAVEGAGVAKKMFDLGNAQRILIENKTVVEKMYSDYFCLKTKVNNPDVPMKDICVVEEGNTAVLGDLSVFLTPENAKDEMVVDMQCSNLEYQETQPVEYSVNILWNFEKGEGEAKILRQDNFQLINIPLTERITERELRNAMLTYKGEGITLEVDGRKPKLNAQGKATSQSVVAKIKSPLSEETLAIDCTVSYALQHGRPMPGADPSDDAGLGGDGTEPPQPELPSIPGLPMPLNAEQRLALMKTQIDQSLSQLPEQVGNRSIETAYEYMGSIMSYAARIQAERAAAGSDPQLLEILAQGVEDQKNFHENMTKAAPLAALIHNVMLSDKVVKSEETKNELGRVMSSRQLESNYGQIFTNVKTMNNMFRISNPLR